jgi:RimJ/RimL family protein N-acetyltransferase
MEVRRAFTRDIPKILDYLEEYHKDSNMNHVEFDRKSTFQIMEYYIDHKTFMPLVAYKEGEVKGVLFGSLEPFFFNRKKSYGTDLMFISNGAGTQLWKMFKEWAFSSGAVQLIMGVSSGNPRSEQLLEALGMTRVGGAYVLRS